MGKSKKTRKTDARQVSLFDVEKETKAQRRTRLWRERQAMAPKGAKCAYGDSQVWWMPGKLIYLPHKRRCRRVWHRRIILKWDKHYWCSSTLEIALRLEALVCEVGP